MATLRKLNSRALLCYAILGLADLGLTLYLLDGSNGRVYESNPIAGAWLSSYGSLGLAAFKALAMVLFAGCVALISLRHPHVGQRLLKVACAVTGGVVVYSIFLVGAVNRAPRPEVHLSEHAAAIQSGIEEEAEPPAPTVLLGIRDGGSN